MLWIPLWLGQAAPGYKDLSQVLASLGAIVGAFFGAVLGSRLPRRLGYFGLCLLSLLVCEFLFLARMHGPFDAWFLAMTVVVGGCSAAFYGWLPLYLPELFPTRVRATGQGFAYNSGRVLAAAGVLLITFGINVAGNYPLASAIVCSVYVVGLILAWFIPETKGQPLPE